MSTTEQEKSVLEEFENYGYSYMNRLFDRWKRRVYFSDAAKARLGCILGYIIGLKHAGELAFAEKMAKDLDAKISTLSPSHGDFVVEQSVKTTIGDAGKEVVTDVSTKVPMRKCIVGDDGTWHGFSLMWYRLLNTEVYEEHLKKHQTDISAEREAGNEVWDTAHQRVVKALKILERIDSTAPYSEELTEYRYLEKGQTKFYYVPGYNGGLIYHGPGAGQTFTTNFGDNPLWGIHT